ncbi:hypothetical protein [Patulibacter sp. SYSU D01012]|uniref:hypothetical protein n=1 Tax=Patulibacter sp. SYSU D01012 TaxID=2817381 RepID=UPI001B306FD7|nr:hypothetical protein [Patulibacter sp. SYSU D01012]
MTAPDGTRRTLPTFTLSTPPETVLAAPDGRHVLVVPTMDGDLVQPPAVLVPTDGGPARRLALPPGVEQGSSAFSWDPAGGAFYDGNAAATAPEDPFGRVVLRCVVATASCAVVAEPSGEVAAVPGGSSCRRGSTAPSRTPPA